ncbi:hypothetical protein ACH5RR_030521 [Cinchona calisaya]|uniref:Uncharacterized protein n=1 Tax=Cinchona calisaya TaxID=153742 RepID=A0ABD2YYI0_9GENT
MRQLKVVTFDDAMAVGWSMYRILKLVQKSDKQKHRYVLEMHRNAVLVRKVINSFIRQSMAVFSESTNFKEGIPVLSRGSDQDFDFFYLVLQWPASYCDTKKSCCFPTPGKPEADFGVHGLWPNYNNGSYPANCNTTKLYDESKVFLTYALKICVQYQGLFLYRGLFTHQIQDLIPAMQKYWPSLNCPSSNGTNFWSHEWDKHGTCTVLDQHSYFKAVLILRKKSNLLQALTSAGIKPDNGLYSLDSIKKAIKNGTGLDAAVECNKDACGHDQLYQVYLCVDKSASELINCPVLPKKQCTTVVEFPAF